MWLEALASDIAALHKRGASVVVVSSGAIALGRTIAKLPKRALKLEDSQASAAIGKSRSPASGRTRSPNAALSRAKCS